MMVLCKNVPCQPEGRQNSAASVNKYFTDLVSLSCPNIRFGLTHPVYVIKCHESGSRIL